MAVVHYQLTAQERRAVSEAARRGASFDRPEMACRTGDGHAVAALAGADREPTWAGVTCPACLATRDTVERRERAVFVYQADGASPHHFNARPGDLLTMPTGAQWFHAYSGAAPIEITDRNRSGLTVG